MDYKQAFQVMTEDKRAHFLFCFFSLFNTRDKGCLFYWAWGVLHMRCPCMCTVPAVAVHMSQISEQQRRLHPSLIKKHSPTFVMSQAIITARRLPLLLPGGLHKTVPGGKMQPVNPVLNCNRACTTVMGEKHTKHTSFVRRWRWFCLSVDKGSGNANCVW